MIKVKSTVNRRPGIGAIDIERPETQADFSVFFFDDYFVITDVIDDPVIAVADAVVVKVVVCTTDEDVIAFAAKQQVYSLPAHKDIGFRSSGEFVTFVTAELESPLIASCGVHGAVSGLDVPVSEVW